MSIQSHNPATIKNAINQVRSTLFTSVLGAMSDQDALDATGKLKYTEDIDYFESENEIDSKTSASHGSGAS